MTQNINLTLSPRSIALSLTHKPIVIDLAGAGPQGPAGPAGPEGAIPSLFEVEAGETISALQPVVLLNNIAFVADCTDPAHQDKLYCVALTGADIGEPVSLITYGSLEDSSWNWTSSSIFIGERVLTSSPPESLFVQRIASVISPTQIFIASSSLIERV